MSESYSHTVNSSGLRKAGRSRTRRQRPAVRRRHGPLCHHHDFRLPLYTGCRDPGRDAENALTLRPVACHSGVRWAHGPRAPSPAE